MGGQEGVMGVGGCVGGGLAEWSGASGLCRVARAWSRPPVPPPCAVSSAYDLFGPPNIGAYGVPLTPCMMYTSVCMAEHRCVWCVTHTVYDVHISVYDRTSVCTVCYSYHIMCMM